MSRPAATEGFQKTQEWIQARCETAHAQLAAAVQEAKTLLADAGMVSKHALYGFLITTMLAWAGTLLARRIFVRRANASTRPRTPDLEKPRQASKTLEREPGVWRPSPFKRPPASPYPDWSLSSTKPLPYRPFRYGPTYHTTMGLRNMDWDSWIELDNQYLAFHATKAQRIAERGARCSQTLPEAYDAAVELLEELVDYLPQRYPSLFTRTERGCENTATGDVFDVVTRPLREDPMQLCGRLVQDDVAIMVERGDGQYYLVAGSILLAGFWRLTDKLGMSLSDIHTSGEVPQFREKLERGMANFFRRVRPEQPVLRHNYFIQLDPQLAWSESIGSEDGEGIGWFSAAKSRVVEQHWFRSERQSLRRLPRSGGVVFTIRTYFHPVVDICEEPYVPGRLASAIRSWGKDVARYKGRERYGEVLLEYLDQKHDEQLRGGLDVGREDDLPPYPY